MRRHVVLAAALTIGLALAGCSSEGESELSPSDRLAAAQDRLESTEGVLLTLQSTGVPSDANGVRSALGNAVLTGGSVKFAGDVEARVSGVAATVEVIAIDDETYMKLFTPSFEPVDLSELGAPNPTTLFAAETGIASLLGATIDPVAGGQAREGRDVLTEVKGTLPGEKIEGLLNLGGPGRTFEAVYGLTEDDELRTATLTGEFFDGAESTYTLVLTDYGETVSIEAPASATN
ncbi:MAG: LppX_LprAFG lipoprotein [Actinomycetia bacterium]|nr:LppX_LprAFG lipoprotein [Actinomycetes bacterium]